MNPLNQEQILSQLLVILEETFEIDPAKVRPDSNLFTELGLDSIDAVDLAVKLQKLTGKRIKPDEFKTVRTVEDAVRAVGTLVGV